MPKLSAPRRRVKTGIVKKLIPFKNIGPRRLKKAIEFSFFDLAIAVIFPFSFISVLFS
jgi:hypothetical protein